MCFTAIMCGNYSIRYLIFKHKFIYCVLSHLPRKGTFCVLCDKYVYTYNIAGKVSGCIIVIINILRLYVYHSVPVSGDIYASFIYNTGTVMVPYKSRITVNTLNYV